MPDTDSQEERMAPSTIPTLKTPLAGLWPGLSAQTRARVRTGLLAAGVLAACLALYAAVQYATPGFADHDGYYHMRMAQLMRVQGLKPDFIWLPLTILNPANFYDHHLLFHVYLSLFAGSNIRGGNLSGGG